MTLKRFFSMLSLTVLTVSFAHSTANADVIVRKTQSTQQTAQTAQTALKTAQGYARDMAHACLGGEWEAQPCMVVVSENTLVMAANYQADLEKSGKKALGEQVKQKCAAATAATRGEYPAYAMQSAYTECANGLYEISEASGMKFDINQYQLLVGAIQCIGKTGNCKMFETGLGQYK